MTYNSAISSCEDLPWSFGVKFFDKMRDVSWQPWTHTYHGSELNMPRTHLLLSINNDKNWSFQLRFLCLPKCSGVKGLGSSPCMFTDMLFPVECFHHFRNRVSIRAWFWHVRLIDRIGEIHSPKLTHPTTLDGWKTTFLMGCTIFSGYVSFKEWCSRINPACANFQT